MFDEIGEYELEKYLATSFKLHHGLTTQETRVLLTNLQPKKIKPGLAIGYCWTKKQVSKKFN